jgi:hypothetical protein
MRNPQWQNLMLGITLMACLSLRAQSSIFRFDLNHRPEEPGSFAYGTLAYQFQALKLDINYSVSSPIHEIVFVSGTGLGFTFASGLPSLPAAGTYSSTRYGSYIDQSVIDNLQLGLSSLYITTVKHPDGEMTGSVVPEPTVLVLVVLGSGLLLLRNRLSEPSEMR